MSTEPDRIAVPTNGRRPHPVATPTRSDVATATGSVPASRVEETGTVPTDADLASAVSPKQLAVGFGVVASILLVVAGRVLRRRSRG
jgi:hypothetical protein